MSNVTVSLLANVLKRTMLSVSGIALGLALMLKAQVSPSGNMVCTVIGTGGMSCNGPGPIPVRNDRERKSPQLLDRLFIVKPGAALNQPNPSADCLIVGIARGRPGEREGALSACLSAKRLRKPYAQGTAVSPTEQGFYRR